MNKKKRAYFIGIAGKTMAPLAKAFKDLGWDVSGSDQVKIYPPVSTYLQDNNILYKQGYDENNIPFDCDLVVVGRSALLIDKDNPEYLKAIKLGYKILSYPQVLEQYLVKENSIVIAGTFGKSTTASIITWILINAGLNPSFMFGGLPINFDSGTKITESNYSIIEGDETPALKENDPPKFMFYKPKYLLLTATEYDHPEIYKTKEEYVNAFIKLVELLPKEGVLFYDPGKVDEKVINSCKSQKIKYLTNYELNINERFKESALRAITICKYLNVNENIIKDAILSFKGLKGRMELIGEYKGRFIYHDLSQQASKVNAALSVIKHLHNSGKMYVVFNPSATSLKHKNGLQGYLNVFSFAEKVYIGKVNFLSNVTEANRVKGSDLVEAFGGGNNICYEPIEENIVSLLKNETKTGDIIVFMSSGGLNFMNLIEKVKNKLKEV